ncbi:MAG: hypothetical protein GAK28_03743 [Luteibacter sp.]|uniref:O-methyltransferase n=1 Tax=Luteibacter sp. TaxID=1886636 RepID=UPI00137DE7B4|nr:class I SAM-dependent methyltransferase [Luteibacter sp.]KAF1004730.1 MAG: hypothetical protein GAK28_03743 [Luteibacter sp.]
MNSLDTGRVAQTLARLFKEADKADGALMAQFAEVMASEENMQEVLAGHLAEERRDLRGVYRGYVDNFLNVQPEYGRFLYQCARTRGARRIVEFGTSMGISTIYLAAALRDMGGGRLIGTELEQSKAERAMAHLEEAGLSDLVEIRVGDARETLLGLEGDIDLVLLDGALSLYLPILKLLEPSLTAGTPILGENADLDGDYLTYVREPTNGYMSQPLPISEGRVSEYTIVTW